MRFLITAGPTKEAIDPVRYITNRSSGKMGYSLAEAAAHDGHRVLLISGPTSLDVPHGVDFLPVETAQEMYDAVQNQAPYADIAILSAAVADYRPVSVPDRKIKKTGERMILELERTKDILGSSAWNSASAAFWSALRRKPTTWNPMRAASWSASNAI